VTGAARGALDGAEDREFAIRLKHITKRFGHVVANRSISLDVVAGSIHGIVGENGAGKSTLMSILYGFYQADSGHIEIRGERVRIRSSRAAIDVGIGMVHQHFMLVDTFTVLENVMLGAETGARLGPAITHARAALQRLSDTFGIEVDPHAICGSLSVGARQRVEILKALYRGAEILVLDEPTGVLTPQEADQLFVVLRALRARSVTVLLITHKLREILAITDSVSVMRAGEIVGTVATAETSREALAELMVGRKVLLDVAKSARVAQAPVLQVDALCVASEGVRRAVDAVTFNVRAGEIVGIAGVAGNGQSELLEALAGIRAVASGQFSVGEHCVTPRQPCGPREMRSLGVAHVPEDRLRAGLVADFSALDSALLGYQDDPAYSRYGFLSYQAITAHCNHCIEQFDVRPADASLRTGGFSGGNQQKLLLARELGRNPKLLLVGQPTRGVDIGAIELIHRRLIEMRDAGAAVLLVSVELDEIMSLSDRILVMFEGRIVADVNAASTTERELGLMMANAHSSSDGNVSEGAS
jgi:general nucleoside transport system ATP-binding protein